MHEDSAIDAAIAYIQASPIGPALTHLQGVVTQVTTPLLAAAEAQFGEGFYVGWSDWFVKNQGQIMQGLMMLVMLVMRTYITRRSSRTEANRAMLIRQKKEDDEAAADAADAAAEATTSAHVVEEREVPAATVTPKATKQRAAKNAKK